MIFGLQFAAHAISQGPKLHVRQCFNYPFLHIRMVSRVIVVMVDSVALLRFKRIKTTINQNYTNSKYTDCYTEQTHKLMN